MESVMNMRVLYLDLFVCLNLTLDYLLLILTARLTGVPVRRWRAFAAGAAGALLAIFLFFSEFRIVSALLVKAFTGWLMVWIAFGRVGWKRQLRLTGVLLVQAFAFAGAMYALQSLGLGRITVQNGVAYFQVSSRQILLCAVGAFFLFQLLFGDHALKLEKRRLRMQASLGERQIETRLLLDTGNLLREPMSGQPVILLAPETAAGLFPPEIAAALHRKDGWDSMLLFQKLVEETGTAARLIPLGTAGSKKGIIIAVKPTSITLECGKNQACWIGIAPADIDVCGGCRGLIGAL